MQRLTILKDLIIFTAGIVLGASIGLFIQIHKQKVITRNAILRLRYCAKPNSYLTRMYASNKTFLMYLHKKDYKAIAIGLKAENKALQRAILWNEVNMIQ